MSRTRSIHGFEILLGKKFGKLLLIEIPEIQQGRSRVICLCECGKRIEVTFRSLRNGKVRSCGCFKISEIKKRFTTHGLYKSPLYQLWLSLKRRCYNQNQRNYKRYGGRGITVCDEWRNDFMAFYRWAISHGYKRPQKGKRNKQELDRTNNDGNYEPLNCRFVSKVVNSRNTSTNRFIEYKGKVMTITEMSKKYKLTYGIVSRRLKRGWTIEKALTTKVLR